MSAAMGSNFLRAIAASADGSVWFGSREGGVSRLKEGAWSRITTANGLQSNGIRCLLDSPMPSKAPVVWIATDAGLAVYSNDQARVVDVEAGLADTTINCLLETEVEGAETLWVGTSSGLVRHTGDEWVVYDTTKGLPSNDVLSLLVADDKWDNRALLCKILASLGFEVREATNEEAAVEVWETWAPDLIWMDTRMPGTDGIVATRRIREREDRERRCRILALTTSEFEQDSTGVRRAGFDGVVTTPYQESDIFGALECHLGVRYIYQTPSALIVPDDANDLEPSDLGKLPTDLRDLLHRYIDEGDIEGALTTVDLVRTHDEQLAISLQSMLKSYRLDDLLDLFERA
jgi:CheY-like chemotaxis protein